MNLQERTDAVANAMRNSDLVSRVVVITPGHVVAYDKNCYGEGPEKCVTAVSIVLDDDDPPADQRRIDAALEMLRDKAARLLAEEGLSRHYRWEGERLMRVDA